MNIINLNNESYYVILIIIIYVKLHTIFYFYFGLENSYNLKLEDLKHVV